MKMPYTVTSLLISRNKTETTVNINNSDKSKMNASLWRMYKILPVIACRKLSWQFTDKR